MSVNIHKSHNNQIIEKIVRAVPAPPAIATAANCG